MAKNISFCEEERSKVQKVFEGLISEQEESQFNAWIERCWNKEMEKAIVETRESTCRDEVCSIMDVGSVTRLLLKTKDDCRNESALSFKMKGNDYFLLKNYRCATAAYQNGILLEPPDQELLASLYNNLSAVRFYFKDYGTSLSHCEKALKIKPTNEKVLARKALCLQKLRESYDAADSVTKMINTMMFCYLNTVCGRRARIQSKEMNETQQRMNKLLIKTIRQRKYRFDSGKIDLANLTPVRDELKVHRVFLIHGRIIWPAFIEFPDFGKLYLIQQFDENESVQDVIADLLPISADCCKYLPEFFQVYFMRERIMFPVDMTKTLKEILSLKDYVVHYGTPDFTAFVKGGKQESLFLEQCNLD